jgi:hypothetical protein
MPLTGSARCPACDDAADLCSKCGGRAVAPVAGAAAVRGARWAERVVKALIRRWPSRWPYSPRAVSLAWKQVADLASRDDVRAALARIALDAAAVRYSQLVDVLARRRLELPERDDDETPK